MLSMWRMRSKLEALLYARRKVHKIIGIIRARSCIDVMHNQKPLCSAVDASIVTLAQKAPRRVNLFERVDRKAGEGQACRRGDFDTEPSRKQSQLLFFPGGAPPATSPQAALLGLSPGAYESSLSGDVNRHTKEVFSIAREPSAVCHYNRAHFPTIQDTVVSEGRMLMQLVVTE